MPLLRSFCIAFSMYSRIPMPWSPDWKEEDGRFAVAFFPLVGAVIGACVYAWLLIWQKTAVPRIAANASAVGSALSAAGDVTQAVRLPQLAPVLITCIIPLVITGGIHLDGFMDTSDARHSYGSREKKLAILKDPNIGAFAVIRTIILCAVFAAAVDVIFCSCAVGNTGPAGLASAAGNTGPAGLASAAGNTGPAGVSGPSGILGAARIIRTVQNRRIIVYCLCFVLSRALSGIALLTLPGARKNGMLQSLKETSEKASGVNRVILCAEAAAVVILMCLSDIIAGLAVTGAAAAVFWHYRCAAIREFGGTTGDLAGWFLCRCEAAMAAALAVVCMVV